MLPTQQLLEKVSKEIMSVPNRKKESKRRVHFCCFLLCHKAGLRVSEAVSFSLANKTRQGLYRIERLKGKKERLVYIPKKVIRELRKNNWKPNQTNRWNFYHFLRKIKRELGISANVELTPHTLRRAFATYHAESGLSLPILSKMLGHASVRTTALYWQNIYRGNDDDNDTMDILTGKIWLERKQPSPITEIFPETPKPPFTINQPVIPNKKPVQPYNSLSVPKTLKKSLGMLISEISPQSPGKFFLNNADKKSDHLKTNQPLAIIVDKEQKPTAKELILLQKIKHLEEQLKQTQTKNGNLTSQLIKSEQEKKELAIKLVNSEKLNQSEKERANYYRQQLKSIAKSLYQWSKIRYYQQLEQKAQIEQLPPWKSNK